MKPLIILLFPLSFFAQSFKFDNAVWYMSGMNWNEEEFSVASKDVFQTTKKVGKITSKPLVYYKLNSTQAIKLNGKETKQFFITQDSATGKVFIASFMDEEKLYPLYDFSLNIGDTINSILTEISGLTSPMIVKEVTEETHGGKARKTLICHIPNDGTTRTYKFIEGIGTTQGLLADINPKHKDVSVLKCYKSEGVTIYENGECKSPPQRKRPTRSSNG